jgi:hypothetical protein
MRRPACFTIFAASHQSSYGLHGPGHGEGGGGGESADDGGLDGAEEGAVAREAALDEAEEEQRRERHGDGHGHGARGLRHEHVGEQRHQPARDVGQRDGGGAHQRAPGLGPLQPELELHHELQPRLGVVAEGGHHGAVLLRAQPVLRQDVGDLGGLCIICMRKCTGRTRRWSDDLTTYICVSRLKTRRLLTDVGDGVDLVLLALQLPVVVVSLALRRQVPERTHSTATEEVSFGGWVAGLKRHLFGSDSCGPNCVSAGPQTVGNTNKQMNKKAVRNFSEFLSFS